MARNCPDWRKEDRAVTAGCRTPQGEPYAIAVGTDVQNSIYVCRLAEQGPCPILRHFRGHHDSVTSVGVSRDLRLLVSGSTDGTMRFWSLADYAQGTTPWGRWGASLPCAATNSG